MTYDIILGQRYGCLIVVDEGQEYLELCRKRAQTIQEEKNEFIDAVHQGRLQRKDWEGWDGSHYTATAAYVYVPKTFSTNGESITEKSFDQQIHKIMVDAAIPHYKCKCKKCGKYRYYTRETLEANPSFCYWPMFRSGNHTSSVRASNATFRKMQKYGANQAVNLVTSKEEVIPSTVYCDAWNKKKKIELQKKEEKETSLIAEARRTFAKNYDIDFTKTRYESLDILECTNDHLESTPLSYRRGKGYFPITVFKQYRCRCYLCGKEQLICCDKFGIYPPTEYGVRAYQGYWSDVSCDCHVISSFQWIVTDILMKNKMEYQVEVVAEGLTGVDDKTPLRFDFAIYSAGTIKAFIECQGEQHYMSVREFGGDYSYKKQRENDEKKREYARRKNIPLIEISYKDKKYDTVESILKERLRELFANTHV